MTEEIKIYTSYFAQLKNLPKYIIPIAICGKSPDWYNGLEYRKLAPKWSFFKQWKETGDNDYYIEHFNIEVLNQLTFSQVFFELHNLAVQAEPGYEGICLICYEKPDSFCHRHLVAEWFNKNGFKCKEWEKSDV